MRRAVALLLVLVALAACSGDDAEDRPEGPDDDAVTTTAAPKRGGRIVVGLEGPVDNLDPAATPFTPSELSAALAVFDPLLVTDDDGDAVPYLASSFEGNDEATRWVIGLRPGVVFSDGTPVDAAAVVATFDRVLTSPALQGAVRRLRGITAIDDHAVEITTEPWPELPSLLTGQLGLVRSPADAPADADPMTVSGTGPFVVRDVVPGDRLTLVRNERHWRWEADGVPLADEIELRTVADVEDRIAQLARGDLDVIHVAGEAALDALWDTEDVLVAEPSTTGRAVVLVTNPATVDPCVAEAAAGDGTCDEPVEVVIRTDLPDEVLEPVVATLADGNVTVMVEAADSSSLAAEELIGAVDALVRVDDGLLAGGRLDGAPLTRTVLARIPWAYGGAEDVGGLLGSLPLPDDARGRTTAPAGIVVPAALHRTDGP